LELKSQTLELIDSNVGLQNSNSGVKKPNVGQKNSNAWLKNSNVWNKLRNNRLRFAEPSDLSKYFIFKIRILKEKRQSHEQQPWRLSAFARNKKNA